MGSTYEWRGAFADDESSRLHGEGFGHRVLDDRWAARVARWSLGSVAARDDEGLVGFVDVPWDGVVHAFYLDACGFKSVPAGLIELQTAPTPRPAGHATPVPWSGQ